MIENFLPYTRYLKEKTLFPSVKRVLNFCFVLGISSFLFEKFYFKYSLLDLTDYKGVYDFIARGKFIIPFSIFFLVWLSTNFIAEFIFHILNYIISEIWRAKILDRSVKKNEFFKSFKTMQKKIEERENVKLRKDWFVHLYQEIKKSFTPKEQEEMKKQINLYKRRVTTDSVLLLRTLIAIIIFYLTIDYFGWLLLLILLTILIISFVLLVIGYQMAELLPIGIRRISAEIEQYIKDNYPEE